MRITNTPIQPIPMPTATPAASWSTMMRTRPGMPPSGPVPSDQAVAMVTSSTIGASLKPDSPSTTARTWDGSGTRLSTEKTAAESVGERMAPSRTATGSGNPRTKCANTETSTTETPTPSVASSTACGSACRMSSQRVV